MKTTKATNLSQDQQSTDSKTEPGASNASMDQLLAFIREKYFDFVPDLQDGEFHEFETEKQKGWYISSRLLLGSGETIVTLTFGDWRTGQRFSTYTKGKFSKAQNEEIKKRIAEQEEEGVRRRTERWEYAAKIAQERLLQTTEHTPVKNAYLERKKIMDVPGVRFDPREKYALVIPNTDFDGKIWGMETIHPHQKRFMKWQRTTGTFHVIGELDDTPKCVLIAEGFSTAASVYLATKTPTFIAFNAGNLENVARLVRNKFTETQIIIAGDDDAHNKVNQGRMKAEQAARSVNGLAIFPIIHSGMSKEAKDWNDLHRLEGLEEVKKQIEGAQTRVDYINCLGYNDDIYYYTSSSNPQINPLRDHGAEHLLKLMPLDYWEKQYGEQKKKEFTINWIRAKSELMALCREQGIFEPKRIRGRGVWLEQGKPLIHLGNRIFFNGREYDIRRPPKLEYLYEYSAALPLISEEPLSLSELEWLRELLGMLNYSRPEQKYYLGGWIALAMICGVLHWRPHLWLTGEAGAGKSSVAGLLVKRILEAFKFVDALGASTEAGIRQKLNADAIPVVLDEFESNDKRSAGRVDGLLELARQASTDAGGDIIKGSASGEARTYCARFMALVCSIKTKLSNEADRARFTLVELRRIMGDTNEYKKINELLENLTPEFSRRFFSRIIGLIPVIQENQKLFQKAFAAKHSQRLGQQYGSLLAGWAALISDKVLSPIEVTEIVNSIDLDQELTVNVESDHLSCLRYLLNKQVRGAYSTHTILEMLQNPRMKAELLRFGITTTEHKEFGTGVFIAGNDHPELRTLFRDSPWAAAGWDMALGRITGAIRSHQVRLKGQNLPRGVFIPMNEVVEEFTPPDPNEHGGGQF